MFYFTVDVIISPLTSVRSPVNPDDDEARQTTCAEPSNAVIINQGKIGLMNLGIQISQ